MKVTRAADPDSAVASSQKLFSYPINDSDLRNSASAVKTLRKSRNQGSARLKRVGSGSVGRGRGRSRPETPLLKWKIEEGGGKGKNNVDAEEVDFEEAKMGFGASGRKGRRKMESARKLGAGLWRLQLPESVVLDARKDPLGFQPGAVHACNSYLPNHSSSRAYGCEVKDPLRSPTSILGARNKFSCKVEPPFQFSNYTMEGATKWDPIRLEASDEVHQIHSHMKRLDQQATAVSLVPALEAELEQARASIQELETERRTSKKKMEHFLKKVSEEKAAWRSREHGKIRAFIDDIKGDLSRERKGRQRLEIVNSKLVNELADTKVTAKRYMQEYEKERKARELIEEVCDELAKEIGEDKAEVDALKRESMKLRDEVDDERKMLQMAEVWREERVQMKLVDAKVALEERYSQMNKLVADLETFLRSRGATLDLKDIRAAESLAQAAVSLHVQDVKAFTYEPAHPDDIFSVFEDVNFSEHNEREIESCVAYSPASHASKVHMVSPEVNVNNKDGNHRHSNAFSHQHGEVDDDSGWETVSHLEDQGSCYSPDGSAPSVNKNRRNSNVSGSGTEWEDNPCDETPITEISEVCSLPTKKVSSIARLWRSNNGDNYKIISVDGIHGRKSNGCISSPDRGSGKDGLSPPDLAGQWSSPDSTNPHITRGMKGCIEWPRGHKNSLKAKLLEARMESQKVQIRHVLKQKS